MPLRRVRVLIVGGGIAGCSLWLALRQQTERALARGWGTVFSATVYEKHRSIEPAGAGIALGPNGLRILDRLGVLDRLKVLGGEISRLHVYNDKGQLLRDFDCSFMTRKHGYPLLCAERAELQALLVHQVLRSDSMVTVPGEANKAMRFGKQCILVRDLGLEVGGVQVMFEDGTEAVGDLVVGADGARSAVRSAMYEFSSELGQEPLDVDASLKPRYAGITSLLGVTSSVPESVRGSAFWVLGKGRMYGTWSMGRQKQYWFLTRREELVAPGVERGSEDLEEGRWTPAEALQGMDEMWNWFHPYDAHAMFSRTIRAVKVGFYELPQGQRPLLVGPAVAGGGARVAVVGDAAHAMLPTVHQGANLAIEDAALLANVLAARCSGQGEGAAPLGMEEGDAAPAGTSRETEATFSSGDGEALGRDIRAALQEYATLRAPRVQRVVGMSRRTGIWQTSNNAAVEFLRTTALRMLPDQVLENSLDWIYDYSVPKLETPE